MAAEWKTALNSLGDNQATDQIYVRSDGGSSGEASREFRTTF